jgi:hypothetical protein
MVCPDRSCEGRRANRTDNAVQKLDKAKLADEHRAEYGLPAASHCKEKTTAVRDVCFRFCFLFRPGGALKMSVI